MMESFEIVGETLADGTRVLRPAGRLDAHNATILMQRCKAEAPDDGRLVLNLSAVPFIASSGIGALLALMEEMQQRGGGLRVAEASPAVDSVLRLLNLDQFLPMDASEADSVRALRAA